MNLISSTRAFNAIITILGCNYYARQTEVRGVAVRGEAVTGPGSKRARVCGLFCFCFFVFFIGGVDDGWENL